MRDPGSQKLNKSQQEEHMFSVKSRGEYCAVSLTCGLNVDAAGGCLHQTRGHVVVWVLLREPGVLVAHQAVLKWRQYYQDCIITQMARTSIICLKFWQGPGYKINGTIEWRLNNTVIYNINFEDNKRLPFLPGRANLSQYQLNNNNKLYKVMFA